MPFLTITGATGFVGRAACTEAVARKREVRAVTRAASDMPPGMDHVAVGNIDGATDWGPALANCDVLVHLAARVHVMRESAADPLGSFRRVNVDGTLNLARQAAAAGVRRFVFVSSIKVNGESTAPGKPFSESDAPAPADAYGVSKMEAEQGLRELAARTGMEVAIIRPPLVYGSGVKANFAALLGAIQKGWPLPLGAVQNLRSFVAIDNLVDFIFTCADHPLAANETFLVSDGHDLSTPGLVHGLARAAGMSARMPRVPLWALQAGAALLGKGDALGRLCGNLQLDISRARDVLDWEPPVAVAYALQQTVAGRRDRETSV
ncbi:MAG: SDR family oxidoreductase [Polaromonas sp.]|uniref:UDP-glucose 4-epimerase family protein n=1 Tax=Polaromonas sp. TaxID=1869339 RepID=UPI002488384D|nr:SDR family oxidoreductase [Polaromonas sp.]MDI1236119.1 SDR family oxidoreductase [Polaromonas sp.]